MMCYFLRKNKKKSVKPNSVMNDILQCYMCVLNISYELPDGDLLGVETCSILECH